MNIKSEKTNRLFNGISTFFKPYIVKILTMLVIVFSTLAYILTVVHNANQQYYQEKLTYIQEHTPTLICKYEREHCVKGVHILKYKLFDIGGKIKVSILDDEGEHDVYVEFYEIDIVKELG
jgi:hypothetical protein